MHALMSLFQVDSSVHPETTQENKSDIKIETTIEDEHVEIAGVIRESLNRLEQDDPLLVEAVRERYLVPPSKEPYNWGKGHRRSGLELAGQYGQESTVIVARMSHRKWRETKQQLFDGLTWLCLAAA